MTEIKLDYVDVFDDNREKELTFSSHLIGPNINEKSLFVNIVDGKSMEPLIKHRALVVADLSQKKLEDNCIYLLYYENRMWIKRYKQKNKTFISINKDYSHLVYKESEVYLVAKVLLTFTTL